MVGEGESGVAADDWTSARRQGALLLETLSEPGRMRMARAAEAAANVLSSEAALENHKLGRSPNHARRGAFPRPARLRLTPRSASVSGSAARQSGR